MWNRRIPWTYNLKSYISRSSKIWYTFCLKLKSPSPGKAFPLLLDHSTIDTWWETCLHRSRGAVAHEPSRPWKGAFLWNKRSPRHVSRWREFLALSLSSSDSCLVRSLDTRHRDLRLDCSDKRRVTREITVWLRVPDKEHVRSVHTRAR